MFEKDSEKFCKAIKLLAENEDNLLNFQCYLEHNFDTWLKIYADTPEKIANEISMFATMEI